MMLARSSWGALPSMQLLAKSAARPTNLVAPALAVFPQVRTMAGGARKILQHTKIPLKPVPKHQTQDGTPLPASFYALVRQKKNEIQAERAAAREIRIAEARAVRTAERAARDAARAAAGEAAAASV